MRRLLVALVVLAGACGSPGLGSETESTREANIPATTRGNGTEQPSQTTQPPPAEDGHYGACVLNEIVATPSLLLDVVDVGDAERASIAAWTGERTEAEIADLDGMDRTDVYLATAELKRTAAERAVRQGDLNLVDTSSLVTGSELTLYFPVNAQRPTPPAAGTDMRILAAPRYSVDGVVLQVVAIVDQTSRVIDAGRCTDEYNATLAGLDPPSDIPSGDPFIWFVRDGLRSPDLTAAIDALERPALPSPDEIVADYWDSWQARPVDERPLVFGEVPIQLDGQVTVGGLWIEAEVGVEPAVWTLWSDLGVMVSVALPAAAGPVPIVSPRVGKVHLSAATADGLSEPVASLDVPSSGDVIIIATVSRDGPTLRLTDRAKLADLMGSTPEGLEALYQTYLDTIFFEPA